MFSFGYSADKKTWHYGEEPLLFTCYNFGNLVITDEELLGELSKVPKGTFSLEADVRPMGAAVSDKKYDKPANPAMSILTEANTGMIISCDINEPNEDAMVGLAESVIGFIFKAGVPKEISTSRDDELGHKLTNQYFEEQLARIREIRESERMFYQKVTDIYSTANDYDKFAKTTKDFLKKVQDYAEIQAENSIPMTMEDWANRLDSFIEFNGRDLLMDAGKISAEQAKLHAETQFEKCRIVQDQLFKSDFDMFLESYNE